MIDMDPRITIVTVSRNCVNEIERTLLSVLNQDYPNLEYIVVDGHSTDGTLEVIQSYRDRISQLVSEPDRGVYDAMNKGVRLATGQWCGFMNAGDWYTDHHSVSALFDGVDADGSLRVVYGNTDYLYRDGHRALHPTASLERLAGIISRYQPYTHQAVFYNIADKEDCRYDLRYGIAADYDVACRYWRRYGISAYRYVPLTVCTYKAYDGISSDPSRERQLQKERLLIKIRNRMSCAEILKDTVRCICHEKNRE